MPEDNTYDVAILGGGLAGLTLTRQLLMQRPETRVLIVEKRGFPVSESGYKVGESTVEIGAHYLAEEVGLKKHLVDEQLPKFGLRFFFKQDDQSLAEGTEVGGSEFFPAPGYQVDRGRLENYLAKTVQEMGATLRADARVKQVELGDSANQQEPHRITFEVDKERESIDCRWLIDASGRASFLKRKLNLAEDLGHDINAVWFRIDETIRIDDWCDDSTWQSRTGKVPRRWLSTNHLLGSGYWVWIIPLATGSTSIGIVSDPRLHPLSSMNQFEKAFEWLEEHEPLCAASIAPHRDKLQDFLAIKRMARGCRQVFSADRWAMTGEAAVFLDPLYSPGIDYIAIGNTMICKLIQEDMRGLAPEHLAPTFQSIFLTLFQNNLLTYQDQYAIFGNPRIMSLKYVWDYALYWSFPALLYFNHKLTDPPFIQALSKGIEEMRDMNVKMQQFFRDWHEIDNESHVDQAFIDQRQIEILIQLNAELREKLPDRELKARFTRNVDICRDLMIEIMDRIGRDRPQLATTANGNMSSNGNTLSEHRLDEVFEALNL